MSIMMRNKINLNKVIAIGYLNKLNQYKDLFNSLLTCSLNNQHIGDPMTIELAKLLEKNTVIMFLSLSMNNIQNKGAIALAKALTKNKTLTALHLGSNHIEKNGALALRDALYTNLTISLIIIQANKIPKEIKEEIETLTIMNKKIQKNEDEFQIDSKQERQIETSLLNKHYHSITLALHKSPLKKIPTDCLQFIKSALYHPEFNDFSKRERHLIIYKHLLKTIL